MPTITSKDRALSWSVVGAGAIIETGTTQPGETTIAADTNTLVSDSDEAALLGALTTAGVTALPLPEPGAELGRGEIYDYNGTLLMVRQSHTRTEHDPATVPALFVVYRVDAGEALDWVASEQVYIGTRRVYGGKTYQAIQAHTTQSDWVPSATPNLWVELIEPPAGNVWTIGVTYALNAEVTYEGQTYRCLQSHTAAPQWAPTATIGVLWSVVATTDAWAIGVAYTGDNTAGASNGDQVTYNGRLYRCLQSHTSQAGWTPVIVPALWLDLGAL